jgi:hypothetical protein
MRRIGCRIQDKEDNKLLVEQDMLHDEQDRTSRVGLRASRIYCRMNRIEQAE